MWGRKRKGKRPPGLTETTIQKKKGKSIPGIAVVCSPSTEKKGREKRGGRFSRKRGGPGGGGEKKKRNPLEKGKEKAAGRSVQVDEDTGGSPTGEPNCCRSLGVLGKKKDRDPSVRVPDIVGREGKRGKKGGKRKRPSRPTMRSCESELRGKKGGASGTMLSRASGASREKGKKRDTVAAGGGSAR